jgi:4-diphosphocytidyl-2-C-methyl-D-erythritol kinase
MGAGLGGGSSDGAFTLQLLNLRFNLGISKEQLIAYALQLGSDCPFFLHNKPCYATGRGEVLEDIALDLSQYSFLVVNPGIHINTSWAFSNIIPHDTKRSRLKEAIQEPISGWKNDLVNDFEKPVFDLYPEIKAIRDALYENGALYASMSGSGSTVFGIFPYIAENLAALQLQLPYRTFLIKT